MPLWILTNFGFAYGSQWLRTDVVPSAISSKSGEHERKLKNAKR